MTMVKRKALPRDFLVVDGVDFDSLSFDTDSHAVRTFDHCGFDFDNHRHLQTQGCGFLFQTLHLQAPLSKSKQLQSCWNGTTGYVSAS